MIPHATCGRSHKDAEQLEKCEQRAVARAEREAKKAADIKRRDENARLLGETDFIQKQANQGVAFDRIVTALNRDYPLREQGKWTLWEVVREDTKKLAWQMDLDRATEMRLQRIFTGEWIGHYENPTRDVLDEIPWTDEELKAAAARRREEAKERVA